ncbi:TIM barrel protein [Microlunatus ginsengisoli]|uniref:TIM barrel protein n=2 Tax=Microlunatus ginsengisoli TaxID=363863 RepID=A0ABP6ZEK1_9ACTN
MKPVKAVHTWSLFRTMGRFVAPGSMPMGGLPERQHPEEGGLPLLELPAALAEHGYRSAQLCHFYLPTVEPGYLAELRDAFDRAGVQLECFLIDEGDLAHPDPAVSAAQQDWIAGWLDVAAALGAPRARVVAGKQPPSPGALDTSARGLSRLAERHTDVRIVTENWHALLPDAASVLGLLDRTEGRIGFLVDLGNWSGPTKYAELAAVAGRAETCQAKCRTEADDRLDLADYRSSLEVLRDAGYDGPLALVYDGPDSDEWANLEAEYALVDQVFG